MKKYVLAFILLMFLFSCSSEETEVKEINPKGNIINNETGEFEVLKKNQEIKEVVKSGPIELSISTIQIGELKIAKDMRELYANKEHVGVVAIEMNVVNKEDSDVTIYPDQAVIITNTGEQIDADIWLSDDIGGDFSGKVKKEGNVIFLLDLPIDSINEVELIIDHAHDEDLNQYEKGSFNVLLEI